MRPRGPVRLALVSLAVVAATTASFTSEALSKPTASASFGVNAKGTVTFWKRAATKGVGVALVKKFNATHPGLKVVLQQTSPNQDTSKLATAIRAGTVPDVVGLNDIDVSQFSRVGAFLDLTQYVNALR